MAAAVDNILIEQGADYVQNYQIVDEDTGVPLVLTGATFAAKIRRTFDAAAALISFTVTAIDLSIGQFAVSLTNSQTAGLSLPNYAAAPQNVTREGNYGTWDLEYTLGGVVYRAMQGTVTLSQEDTK
jgi:hypothetical protein